jgi:hypothetical protein
MNSKKQDFTNDQNDSGNQNILIGRDVINSVLVNGDDNTVTINNTTSLPRPDIRIVEVKLTNGKIIDSKMQVSVKNYGFYIAEDVNLHVDFSYFKGLGLKIRELPLQETRIFVFDLFPLSGIDELRQKYMEQIRQFSAGKKALIVRLNFEFTWNNEIIHGKEYDLTMMIDRGRFIAHLL